MRVRFVLILNFSMISSLLLCVKGHPPEKRKVEDKPEEQVLSNGTVVGKYSYRDKEGNPVHVKYYADDQSYGVELNRLKVVSSKSDLTNPNTEASQDEQKAKNGPVDTDRELYDLLESIRYPPVVPRLKVSEPLDYLNKVTVKAFQKNKYKTPEYEVYMKNDLDAPKHCAANAVDDNKIRVYNIDKKRNLPEVDTDDSKFCELF